MPELPGRPDLDQLRRQARELLRAAANGEPQAVRRLRAVSGRTKLSAAQLAIAREYGFPSWPALKAEVEGRRSAGLSAGLSLPGSDQRGVSSGLDERWSFGGAAAIDTTDGVLRPDLLVIGPDRAILSGRLADPWHSTVASASSAETEFQPFPPRLAPLSHQERLEEARRIARRKPPRFDDLIVTDDRGRRYGLRLESMSDHRNQRGAAAVPSPVQIRVEPAPPPGAVWIELRHPSGSAARLLPSPRAAVQVSQATPLPAAAAETDLDELARWLIETKLASPSTDLTRQCSIALTRAAAIQDDAKLDASSQLPGQLAELCAALTGERPAAGLPAAWSGMLSAANLTDGPQHHLDIRSAPPALDGVVTRLDSLFSGPDTWQLMLRAAPGWFAYSEDGRHKWTPVRIYAEDDLGGQYATRFGGSSGRGGHEEVTLIFLPRLDPLARMLKLTLRGGGQQVAVAFDLPAGEASVRMDT
jgi:hypothetical protein